MTDLSTVIKVRDYDKKNVFNLVVQFLTEHIFVIHFFHQMYRHPTEQRGGADTGTSTSSEGKLPRTALL